MGKRREYMDTLIVSKSQIEKIKRAQFEMRMEGFTNQNQNILSNKLSLYTSVLSFAFMLPAPVTLAAAVISVITSTPSERDAIISVCATGEDYLETLENIMEDHPEYQQLEVDFPFLEFVDEGFRIVQGFGTVKRVKINNHWLPAEM